jgi:DNA mismatch repair protein MutS2
LATDILTTLEFDRVRSLLERHCQFSVASERAQELGPSADPRQVEYLLRVTAEAYDLLEHNAGFGVGGCRDIRVELGRAAIGGVLQPDELLAVHSTIAAARRTRSAFRRIDEAATRYAELDEFVGFIVELPSLEADLQRSIGERGDVLDTASDQLRTIRQQLRVAQSRVVERINRYIQAGSQSTALQDPIVTMRDGRYVVPVRADRRTQLPGVVHDTSASGQTLFVEPMEVVELNNRWRELQAAERHEIDRILAMLSGKVGAESEPLTRTLEALAAIDLALAKARLAAALRCSAPVMVDERAEHGRRVLLRRARHPLLDQTTVVPTDLELGDGFRVLVITGPNTGGKTVALKTVGLMAVMAQSGLFIPADAGSELCVFDGIFADIGDEQSIQQSLSTFSSHMTRVIAMLSGVSSDSLVLLDELGAGTDPEEGAALARALIEELLERGCLAIATTHYSELKAFAYTTAGAENGSVEFDVATLSPTYRLTVGVPGRSNALAIARRLGMPDDVLERARGYLNPETERVDTLLAEIKRRRNAAETAERDAQRALVEAQRERDAVLAELAEARHQRELARQESLAEVESELAEARATVRRLRQLPPRVPAETLQPVADASRQELEQATRQVREFRRKRAPQQQPPQPLHIGDHVEMPALGGEGEVVGFSDDGTQADVQMGSFKVRQPLAALRKLSGKRKPEAKPVAVPLPQPRRQVDMELHLRGQRAAGIDEIVDDYLNDAYLTRLPYVRIVHGRGTGVLRDVVRQVLSKHPLVERWETPPENQGGDGVTLAYLRES